MNGIELSANAQFEVSFIMSYNYNGRQIRIMHPVHSISVNNSHVAFSDKCGSKRTRFASALDAKVFIKWLLENASR